MEMIQVEVIVFETWKILGTAGIGFFFGVFSGVTLAIKVWRAKA